MRCKNIVRTSNEFDKKLLIEKLKVKQKKNETSTFVNLTLIGNECARYKNKLFPRLYNIRMMCRRKEE